MFLGVCEITVFGHFFGLVILSYGSLGRPKFSEMGGMAKRRFPGTRSGFHVFWTNFAGNINSLVLGGK